MPNEKELETLFWKLFNCESENEVQDLISSDHYLSNMENWFPYGGENKNDHSNFAIFEAQMPQPVPALVEKITNSIDSMLLKECRLAGIDPKSTSAPKSMGKAVEQFFGIKNGDFSEIGSGRRREISENIQIVATGNREQPCLIVWDNGEGQHPDDFPSTFLSLPRGESNKINIPFVQGKYRMGSTGAVVFCGELRYQLIGSRCHKGLLQRQNDDFGFTLVRRHPLTPHEEETRRSSWYEYLIINGNSVPRFKAADMDFGLANDKRFISGSIVKLFSYQLPRGSRSDITLDLWRELNQCMYSPALPVLLFEKRFGKGHSPSKLMLGNKTRLIIDEREKTEKTISFKHSSELIGEIAIEATVFKPGVPQREFINEKAVVFTLNGQVQGSLRRGFVSGELGLSWLRDSLLINVDCTGIRTSFRQDLFMANRFNLREGKKYEQFIDIITETVKSNDELKELNRQRSNRIIRDDAQNKDILETVLNSIPLDKDFIELLQKGGNLKFLGGDKGNQNGKKKEATKQMPAKKRFPSIFRIKLGDDSDGKKVKSIPLGGKGFIDFETDVEDEYFFRPKDPGDLIIEILGLGKNGGGGGKPTPTKVEDVLEVTRSGPSDGVIRFAFEPKEKLAVGDEIRLNAHLTSPDGDLDCLFFVRITDPSKPPKKRKEPEKSKDRPNLPKPIKVFRIAESDNDVTWAELGWDGNDVVDIKLSEDGKTVTQIAINMDSFALTRFISRKNIRDKTKLKFVKDKYLIDIYLHSLYLYSLFRNIKGIDPTQDDWAEDVMISNIFKEYGQFLLFSSADDVLLQALGDGD
jgi:hypothetical protein